MAHATVALASSDGLWTPAYSTSATAAALEQESFAMGEGPCYDALTRHAPVLVAEFDTGADRYRWPIWTPVARAEGVRSVAAFPIQAGAITAGVLAMFSTDVGVLHGTRLALALRLSDTALLGLIDVLAGLDGLDGAAGSPAAAGPDSAQATAVSELVRADVHQAAGMIMVQAGVPIDQALARLRARAFQRGLPITEIARDVLAHRMRFPSDQDSAE